MAEYFYLGPSLLGAKFVRGRDVLESADCVFLGNWSQRVIIEVEVSGSFPVTSGVPQCSVLGPILFLVFVNNLPEKLLSLFADNTAVYLTVGGSDNGTVLQKDLDRLSVWESQWDMDFNPSVCQVVQENNLLSRGQKYKYCTCPAGPVTYNFYSSCKHMHSFFRRVCNKEHKGVLCNMTCKLPLYHC